MRLAVEGLPKGLDWISNARFGPGVRDVIEGLLRKEDRDRKDS